MNLKRLFIVISSIYLLIALTGVVSISSRLKVIKEKTEALSEAQKSLIKRAEFKDLILQAGRAIEGKREEEISEFIKRARHVIDECYNCHHPDHIVSKIKEVERNVDHLDSLLRARDYGSLYVTIGGLVSFVEMAFEKATSLSRTRLESTFSEIKKTEETTRITVITGLLLFLIFSAIALYRVSLLEEKIKKRERDLRKAVEEWQLTFDSIMDSLLIVDEEGKIIKTNILAQKVFGSDITGHSIEEILNLPELQNGRNLYSLQEGIEFSKKGRTFSLKTYPYSGGPAGKGLILVIRDITREKEMEQRLIQAEKLSALTRTLATVATELYNPLNSVTKYSEVLFDLSSINKRIKEIADRISNSTSRMSSIVGELLSFSKLPVLKKNPVNFPEMMENLLESLRKEASQNINFLLSSEEIVLFIDKVEMEKALKGLITYSINRLRDTPEGGTIEIRGRKDKNLFRIEICDNGPPIPKDELLRIFEPLFFDTLRIQNLNRSYQIIRAHGGDIIIKSRENETTFSIELPVNAS